MKLEIIDSNTTDPEINLKEEIRLGNVVNDNKYILRFWHNSPSVILGRFQDREFEVNEEFLLENNIPVFKRHSGGGTVYHDLGTLNISFIKPKNPKLSSHENKDSDLVTKLILNALLDLNISAYKDERNALFIGDNKILGSAVSLTGNIFCYHASLLFNTNLNNLKKAINWNPHYYDKFKPYVKSHRSKVTNMLDRYPHINLSQIKSTIKTTVLQHLSPKTQINLITSL